MSPEFLTGTYAQYITDLDSIATWLAQTATRCGCTPDLLTDEHIPAKKASKSKSKSKPKSNAQAKKKARNAARRVPANQRQRVIPIANFVLLAIYIANTTEPLVRVPAAFVHACIRVMAVYESFDTYFNYWESKTSDEEIGHGHLSTVLEQLLDVLQSLIIRPSDPDHAPMALTQEHGQVMAGPTDREDLFDRLTVEDASKEFLRTQDNTPTRNTNTQPNLRCQAEPMESRDRFIFAVHALLTDVNNTLGYMGQLWNGYKQGNIDLIQAAVTSNTALDMVRTLETDFLQEFSETFTDWETAVKDVFAEKCKAESYDPQPRLPEDAGFPFNMAMYSDARWAMLTTLSTLFAFQREVLPNCIPMPSTDDRAKYDPSADRSKMSNAEKHREDKKILAKALPEVWFLVKYDKDVPTEDEFTRGLRIMLNTGKITLWTAVASQLFLDVHHILRGQVGVAFLQLLRLNMRAKETLRATITFRDGLRCDEWSIQNDDDIDSNLSRIFDEWILGDPVQKLMERLFKKTILPPGERRLLSQNPLLCGLMAFRLQLQLQEYGIAYADAWKSVTFAAQLYNAVIEEQYCQARWPDMDLLMRLQTPEKLYCGAPPKNVDDYYERCRLTAGYLSSLDANKVTTDCYTRLGKGSKGLHHKSLASLVFKRRYWGNAASQDFSGEDVDMLLSDRVEVESSLDITTAVGAAFGITAPCASIVSISKDYHAWVRASMRKHSGRTERLSPMELLFTTGVFIAEEVPGLYFDYFAFHRTCWEMLLSVRHALRPSIPQYYKPTYFEREDDLPWIVGDIFITAISIREGAIPRNFSEMMRVGREPNQQLLVEAGEAVQHFLEDGEAQGRACEETLRIALARKGFIGHVHNEEKAKAAASADDLEAAETMVAMAN